MPRPGSSPRTSRASTTPARTAADRGSSWNAHPAPLPDGYRLHADETGFQVTVPDGWTVPREGSLADWEAQEVDASTRLGGYARSDSLAVFEVVADSFRPAG